MGADVTVIFGGGYGTFSGRDDITARSPLWKREVFTLQSSLNTFFFH